MPGVTKEERKIQDATGHQHCVVLPLQSQLKKQSVALGQSRIGEEAGAGAQIYTLLSVLAVKTAERAQASGSNDNNVQEAIE